MTQHESGEVVAASISAAVSSALSFNGQFPIGRVSLTLKALSAWWSFWKSPPREGRGTAELLVQLPKVTATLATMFRQDGVAIGEVRWAEGGK